MNQPTISPKKPSPPAIRNTRSPRFQRTKITTTSQQQRPIRHELSAGGVVVREDKGIWHIALLKTEHKRGEVWVLPKGHVEPHAGETVADAAKREVEEEAGITDLSVKNELGVTRFAFQAENALVKKKVHYFLMTTRQVRLTPQADEGLIDAIWAPIDRAIKLLEYDTDQDVVSRARDTLLGRQPSSRRPKPRTANHRRTNRGPGARIHT